LTPLKLSPFYKALLNKSSCTLPPWSAELS
jgi:hypothetical protein